MIDLVFLCASMFAFGMTIGLIVGKHHTRPIERCDIVHSIHPATPKARANGKLAHYVYEKDS